jgi:hypothetical protein
MWEIASKIFYWGLVANVIFRAVGLLIFKVPILFIASRPYGTIPIRVVKKMLIHGFSSKNALALTSALYIVFAGIVVLYVSWFLGELIIISLILSCLSVLCMLAIPPTILLLACSNPQSLDLLSTLTKTFHPLRTVYLLDAENTGSKKIGIRARQRFELNNLRRYDGTSWESLVREVAAFVPNIIVDARSFSPPIDSEISHISSSRTLSGKTIVIANVDGSTPGFKGTLAKNITLSQPSELVGFLAARGLRALGNNITQLMRD